MSKFMAAIRPAEPGTEAVGRPTMWGAWAYRGQACTRSQVQRGPAEGVQRIHVASAIDQSPQGPKHRQADMQELFVRGPQVLSVSVKCSKMQRLHKANICSTDPDQNKTQ